jgi:PhnB protein
MAVNPIPDSYPRVMAYLALDGAGDAIEFYKKVFGATERGVMRMPDGRIGHAEIEIGDSVIMMADAHPEMGFRDPKTVGGTPVTLAVYVEDVDATFKKALDAGATETEAVADKFYGDRTGSFDDPWGHRWNVMTHVEDVSEEEMGKRMAQFSGGS